MRIGNEFISLIKHVVALDKMEDFFGDHRSGAEAISVIREAVDALVAKINAAEAEHEARIQGYRDALPTAGTHTVDEIMANAKDAGEGRA